MEKNGFGIAAVSYDSHETLRDFARQHGIRFPLLSDRESTVIRSFGILNANIAPMLRAHGVPHPVQYLVAPDGLVIRKYFVPNYQHRVTASAVAFREFGAVSEGAATVTLRSGALTLTMGLSAERAFAGQEIGFFARFTLETGWHVYGTPVPDGYTATSVIFDGTAIARQSFELPAATPARMDFLKDFVPVYTGTFQGIGSLLLRFPLDEGTTVLSGMVRFQQCSDSVCEPPETIPFELPLTLAPFMDATRKKS